MPIFNDIQFVVTLFATKPMTWLSIESQVAKQSSRNFFSRVSLKRQIWLICRFNQVGNHWWYQCRVCVCPFVESEEVRSGQQLMMLCRSVMPSLLLLLRSVEVDCHMRLILPPPVSLLLAIIWCPMQRTSRLTSQVCVPPAGIFHYLRQGGYVFVGLCLFVCLCVWAR